MREIPLELSLSHFGYPFTYQLDYKNDVYLQNYRKVYYVQTKYDEYSVINTFEIEVKSSPG